MADQKRAWNFALGLRLGWFQQGAAFGGRVRALMEDDLRAMSSAAPLAGYGGFDALTGSGLRKLEAGQPLSAVTGEAADLIALFQRQAVTPRYAAALNLGIVLGWLQQGAVANNRPLSLARIDIQHSRLHAANAGYAGYAPYLDAAAAALDAGHPVSSLLMGVTSMIALLQGQDLGQDPPADPVPPDGPSPPAEPAPPGGLRILADAAYVGVGEIIAFSTNVPPAQSTRVSWSTSNAEVLKPSAQPNEFQGARAGRATVTARYARQEASALIRVTAAAGDAVVPPPDPAKIALYPGTGARVYRDEVICAFKPDVDAVIQHAILTQHGLIRIGVIPDLGSHLVRFDDTQTTMPAVVAALSADPRVSSAAPHGVLIYGSMLEHRPSEIGPLMTWPHLEKVDAFAAFALLRRLARTPQRITFIDGGIWLDASGAAHIDFADRIDLPSCMTIGFSGDTWSHPVTLADLQDHGTDPYEDFHANKVIGAALAAWNNGAGVGIDPAARASLIRCGTIYAAQEGVRKAADWMHQTSRVVNVAIDSEWRLKVGRAIRPVIDKGGLVVIAAGNSGGEVHEMSFGSAHRDFPGAEGERYRDAIIVVAGTETKTDAEGPETAWPQSNFDSWRSYIDLAAPAVVRTSGPDNDAITATGTSFAAPLVSATAAAIFSLRPEQTAKWVKECLIKSSDPIESKPQANPPYRLWSPKYIGKGRLNVWQALLYAVNVREQDAVSNTRYAGLRITADRAGLKLFLEMPDGTLLPQGASFLSEAHRTTATRVTLTNAEPFAWPVALIAREAGSTKIIYRLPLPPPAAIDALEPRFVVTVRAYTGGRFVLNQDTQHPVPHQSRFSIFNLALEPAELELLDPFERTAWDKSLRPWMKLSAGDSFAMRATIVSGPPGTTVAILDKDQRPFPAAQHEGTDPYVTVPFRNGEQAFFVRAKFPGGGAAEAKVKVEVYSLNNHAVTETKAITLSRGNIQGGQLPGFLERPLRWWQFGMLQLRNPGPGAVSTRLWFYPSEGWTAQYHEYSPWIDVSLAAGEETRVKVRFSPKPGATVPPGTSGTCDVIAKDEDGNPAGFQHRFRGVVEPPPVVRVEAASFQAGSVRKVPGENYVFAELPIAIVNDSPYAVLLRRHYLKVAGGALSAAHEEPAQIPYPDAGGIQSVAAGATLATKLMLFYDLAMVDSTNPVVVTHTVTVLLEDPNLEMWLSPFPPPDYDGYTARPFDVQVRLALAGPAPPAGRS